MSRRPLPRCWHAGVAKLSIERTEAREHGAACARAGLSRDCNPHEGNAALYASWDFGWRHPNPK